MVMIVVQSLPHRDPGDETIIERHDRREILVSPCMTPAVDQIVQEEHIQKRMRPRNDEHRPESEHGPEYRDPDKKSEECAMEKDSLRGGWYDIPCIPENIRVSGGAAIQEDVPELDLPKPQKKRTMRIAIRIGMRVVAKVDRNPFLAIDPRGQPKSELHEELERRVESHRPMRRSPMKVHGGEE